jgi:predicted PurR-regulated permease PerM
MMVFMLWEAMILPEKLHAAHKDSAIDPERLRHLVGRLQHYLLLKTVISLMVGVASGVLAWAVGVDFALFWGFLAFLLHYIPNIGAFLAGVPACLLALLQLGPARALVLALGFLVINTVFGNLLEPAVMGRGLRLSPLVVFLALVIWGSIWGALGMILSVPLTVALRIVFESIESTRWLAALLGRRPRVAE